MKKNKPSFYVINWNFNKDDIEYYDIMPYLINCWERKKKNKKEKVPETFDEFKKFIDYESKYNFWARCEYEVIVSGWPKQKKEVKIDIYQQIEKNIDIITDLFIKYVS